MKITIVALLVCIGFTTFGQTLERKFSLAVTYFKFNSTEDGFAEFDQNSKSVNVYNSSSQLIKSTSFSFAGSLYLVSKTIIANDGKFKYVVSHNNSISIYDENGIELFKRDSAIVAKFYNTISGPKMMLLSSSGGWAELYSLTGSLTLMTKTINPIIMEIEVYPNPANKSLIIQTSFQIKDDESTIINFYDLNGQLVNKINCKMIENLINVDTENLARGQYLIQVSSNGINSTAKKLILN